MACLHADNRALARLAVTVDEEMHIAGEHFPLPGIRCHTHGMEHAFGIEAQRKSMQRVHEAHLPLICAQAVLSRS